MRFLRKEKYNVFISYRRDGGAAFAKLLCDTLAKRGYLVFLDVDSNGPGPFDENLYRVIEHSTDFLLILSPNALDRCEHEKDWVRLEIERAKECGKNIVPVMLKGFDFPEKLPESIDFIHLQQGLEPAPPAFFDASVDKLVKLMRSQPMPRRKRLFIAAASLVLAAALLFGAYYCWHTYPLFTTDKNTVSALITYMSSNIQQIDLASQDYVKELDRAMSYIKGETTDSETELRYELTNCIEAIRARKDYVTSPVDQLRQELSSSRFDAGDLDAFRPMLVNLLNEYADHLAYVRDNIIPNNYLRTEHKSDYLTLLKGCAELDAEILFYNLNETLLPVTNEKALETLKKDILPNMTFIYGNRKEMTHSKTDLQGLQNAVFSQYDTLLAAYEESVRREQDNASDETILGEIDLLIQMRESRGLDTSELEEMRARIADKLERIEAAKQDIVELDQQLAEARAKAYEKFKPLEDDDLPTLWGKGKRFLTIHMTEAAAECFALYAEKGEGEDKIAGISGKKFAECCTSLGLEGGVVVCLYEENLPHQAVELGDVIYAVEGEPVRNYGEYSAAVAGDGRYTVSILRFTAKGYELTEATIVKGDKTLGRIALLGLIDEAQ